MKRSCKKGYNLLLHLHGRAGFDAVELQLQRLQHHLHLMSFEHFPHKAVAATAGPLGKCFCAVK
eukprot:1136471-Pelagomonas_calceolata.AAC.12